MHNINRFIAPLVLASGLLVAPAVVQVQFASGQETVEFPSSRPQAPATRNGFDGGNAIPTPGDVSFGKHFTTSGTGEAAPADEEWAWHVFPDGVMYRSYLAGGREPRLAGQWVYDRSQGWLWDVALGGRAALLRYGTQDGVWPEGWEVDVEGAALARLNWTTRDLWTTDFRAGLPLTYRQGPWEAKVGYYHLSSHLGDLYMLANPEWPRVRYVRDALVAGIGWRPIRPLRFYFETSWAFNAPGEAQPWEFQFGAEYSSVEPADWRGTPFVAVNTLLRQEVGYSGSLRAEAGWQWRKPSGQLFRVGVLYFNGLSDQGQFYNRFEEQTGLAMWYDF